MCGVGRSGHAAVDAHATLSMPNSKGYFSASKRTIVHGSGRGYSKPATDKTVAPCDRRIVPEACYTDSAHVATGSTEPPPGCMNQTAVDFSVVLNRPAGRASRLCLCTLMEKRLTHGGLRYVRWRTERLAQEEDHGWLRLRSPAHWARPRIGANVLRRQYDGSLHVSVFHTCGPISIL